ncbi:MAG: helix-turn-helix transcriptional regulator [Clostridia bacterium]|nr:helix-turn-helix transcriptional regulator [Clostridia bacterium]MBQ3938424.1 helix-turn-helix transcriptional regulator [Clostridia bacterium]
MKTMLAENIKRFRKERALTQEQLSEVLGVTPGAVYKWEAKLSVPDLDLIIEMADFFDTSVDVLLGYQVKDNRLEATVKRLQEYRRSKDREGLAEAEKALRKYPHSFRIVTESAALYRFFGFESGDKALFRRALELLERSRLLLPQNEDPQISEQTIYGRIAHTYLGLGETDKAIELWKTHNADGVYSAKIGHILAQSDHTDEAVPYLSEALARILADLVSTIVGYLNVYLKRGDHASCRAILSWGIGLLTGLRKADKPNYFDRIGAVFLAALAGAQFLSGQRDEARDTLIKAKRLAAFFDAAPSYDESDIRFMTRIEGASAHDDMGATAADAVDHAVNQFDNEELTALWRSLAEQEDHHE